MNKSDARDLQEKYLCDDDEAAAQQMQRWMQPMTRKQTSSGVTFKCLGFLLPPVVRRRRRREDALQKG